MGGQRNLIILGVAVLLGLVAVFLANSYFSGVEQRQVRQAEQQKLARIVVASQPLGFGTQLTSANVRLQNWPASSIPEGAFISVEAALAHNRVALRPIVPGEPVLADKVSGTDGRATLAANLPQGMRATSIPISAVTGVSGFVLPGTSVDVLLTRQIPGAGSGSDDQMSDVIMENVQVLAIDQMADEKSGDPKPGGTAVLQTDLLGAQKLAIAQKIGTLSLALRNVENQQPAQLGTVTTRDLGGAGYYRPGRPQPAAVTPAAFAAAVPRLPRAAAVVPVIPAGPAMTVYRGTASTDYQVGTPKGN